MIPCGCTPTPSESVDLSAFFTNPSTRRWGATDGPPHSSRDSENPRESPGPPPRTPRIRGDSRFRGGADGENTSRRERCERVGERLRARSHFTLRRNACVGGQQEASVVTPSGLSPFWALGQPRDASEAVYTKEPMVNVGGRDVGAVFFFGWCHDPRGARLPSSRAMSARWNTRSETRRDARGSSPTPGVEGGRASTTSAAASRRNGAPMVGSLWDSKAGAAESTTARERWPDSAGTRRGRTLLEWPRKTRPFRRQPLVRDVRSPFTT
jgi:hypothetical protein